MSVGSGFGKIKYSIPWMMAELSLRKNLCKYFAIKLDKHANTRAKGNHIPNINE